jgi:hypothetical protein
MVKAFARCGNLQGNSSGLSEETIKGDFPMVFGKDFKLVAEQR